MSGTKYPSTAPLQSYLELIMKLVAKLESCCVLNSALQTLQQGASRKYFVNSLCIESVFARPSIVIDGCLSDEENARAMAIVEKLFFDIPETPRLQ